MPIRGSKRFRKWQLANAINDMGCPPSKADQLRRDMATDFRAQVKECLNVKQTTGVIEVICIPDPLVMRPGKTY